MKYRLTMRVQISPGDRYTGEGVASEVQRIVQAEDFMELARLLQPLHDLAQAIGYAVPDK